MIAAAVPDPKEADSVAQTIAGQDQGEQLLRTLNSCSDADAVFDAVIGLSPANELTRARLRGFCRALQKRLERMPAS